MAERRSLRVGWSPLLLAVAAYGIPGTSRALPAGPLAASQWSALLADAGRHRVVGLLAACANDGALAVTADQLEELGDAHGATMARVLDIEAAALHAIGILADAGVEVRVLKGLATAHLDMADPSQREFGDVDLLAEPDAFEHAIGVLSAAGLLRDLPERRAGFDRRFGKDATLYGRSGVEIDLHRTLALGAFGMALAPSAVWGGGEPFQIGPRTLRALSAAARLLNACYSAALGDRVPRLPALRDVAQLAARSGVACDEVVGLAERARGAAVVAYAVRLAGETFGAGPAWGLWGWAASRAESTWERAALASYESQGGSNTSTLLGGVLGLRSTGARLSYLSALGFPDGRYARARRVAGRPAERASGVRELVAGLRPRRRAT